MDIFLSDPNEIPLPPQEVRILELKALPWQDDRRVQLYLEVTPFQKRPNSEISITNVKGDELAFISIIESIGRKMEFTMHLRGAELTGPFSVSAILFYFEEEERASGDNAPPEPQKRLVVDQRNLTFIFQESEGQN